MEVILAHNNYNSVLIGTLRKCVRHLIFLCRFYFDGKVSKSKISDAVGGIAKRVKCLKIINVWDPDLSILKDFFIIMMTQGDLHVLFSLVLYAAPDQFLHNFDIVKWHSYLKSGGYCICSSHILLNSSYRVF